MLGLYQIEFKDKGAIYVIVQRNMDDLPFETKLLTFDFKGSTVDRQVIAKEDCGLPREKIWKKYKDKVLKDKDLNITGLKFILDFKDWRTITSIIDRHLGKGKKVSDCTEINAPQLDLILYDLRLLSTESN